jgi:hypothetical protein
MRRTRIKTFTISEILDNIGFYEGSRILSKFNVNITPRLLTFKVDGIKCHHCGLEGSFFALERFEKDGSPHLNLYATKDGKEVLMTSDHIIPKSKGGINNVSNRQCLCEKCNNKKGSII